MLSVCQCWRPLCPLNVEAPLASLFSALFPALLALSLLALEEARGNAQQHPHYCTPTHTKIFSATAEHTP